MTRSSAFPPIPLPRQREREQNPAGAARLSAVPAQPEDINRTSGLTPATPIQKDEISPLTRPDTIQIDERESTRRLTYLARVKSIRALCGQLVDELARENELELLDLMRDDHAPYSRYRSAEKARAMAIDAGRQLQLGFMMLDHAVERPDEF